MTKQSAAALFLLTLGALSWWLAALTDPARADAPVDDAYLVRLVPVSAGFSQPVGIANAGDSRLFVVERAGVIWIVDESGVRPEEPFLDIRERVNDTFWEQGLLGLAFHPSFTQNSYFYVHYTGFSGANIIARFKVLPGNPDVADPNSEAIILQEAQPSATHNGGDLRFGPDGNLYASIGEGGGAASLPNAQDGNNLLGKIIRLDVNGGFPYEIPPDNPFVGDPAVRDEIWLLGLRNPWRFSFDALTGDLFIGDVGGASYEEIDRLAADETAGLNFGWPCFEGYLPYRPEFCPPGFAPQPPILVYPNPADGCAVVGGFVYRGNRFPAMVGDYIFTDACRGTLWRARQHTPGVWQRQVVGGGLHALSSLGESAAGELFAVGLQSGILFHLEAVPAAPTFIPIARSR